MTWLEIVKGSDMVEIISAKDFDLGVGGNRRCSAG
jgi:hypothetical protein